MNTFEFSRYLMNALESDLKEFECSQDASASAVLRGFATARKITLSVACSDWVKFPKSLQLEARRLIRYAEKALNE